MTTLAKAFAHTLTTFTLGAAAISPAWAGAPQSATVTLTTAGLDLSTAKGQRMLDQRIEKAARTVCRTTTVQTGSRVINQDAQTCLAKARSDARRQLAPMTARNEQRGN